MLKTKTNLRVKLQDVQDFSGNPWLEQISHRRLDEPRLIHTLRSRSWLPSPSQDILHLLGFDVSQMSCLSLRHESVQKVLHADVSLEEVIGYFLRRTGLERILRIFRQNSQKTECVFTRCPTSGRKKIACIYGLRSEGVNYVFISDLFQ